MHVTSDIKYTDYVGHIRASYVRWKWKATLLIHLSYQALLIQSNSHTQEWLDIHHGIVFVQK